MEHKNWLDPFHDDPWRGEDSRWFGLMPRYFNHFFNAGNIGPSVDLQETDTEVILRADIPGVNREDLDITVDENRVILKGETRKDTTREEKGYHLTERRYGSFQRIIPLPAEMNSRQASAKYKNGVLEVVVPKVENGARKAFKPQIQFDDPAPGGGQH